jgi:hypothetical protein
MAAARPLSRLKLIAERPTVPDGYAIDRNPRHFGTAAIQISGEKDAKLAQKLGQRVSTFYSSCTQDGKPPNTCRLFGADARSRDKALTIDQHWLTSAVSASL